MLIHYISASNDCIYNFSHHLTFTSTYLVVTLKWDLIGPVPITDMQAPLPLLKYFFKLGFWSKNMRNVLKPMEKQFTHSPVQDKEKNLLRFWWNIFCIRFRWFRWHIFCREIFFILESSEAHFDPVASKIGAKLNN